MDNETFKILAQHFGDSSRVQVRFEAGACPKTDGNEIILPDDLADGGDIMLSALLHESAHIAYTDFNVTPESIRPRPQVMFIVLNALEDIRINAKTAARYPAAWDFGRISVQDVIDRNAADMVKEPRPMQIIKALILITMQAGDLATRAYPPDIMAIAGDLDTRFTARIIAADNTRALLSLVDEIAAAIALLSDGQHPPPAGLKDAAQRRAAAGQEAAQSQANIDQSNKDSQAAFEAAQEKYTQYKQARTQRRANETKYNRAAQEARRTGQNPAQNPAMQAASKRAAAYAKQEQEAGKAYNDLRAEASEHSQQTQQHTQARDAARGRMAQEDNNLIQAAAETFDGVTAGVSLSGFDSVDINALRLKASFVASQSLSETIKAALIAKRDQIQTDDGGHAINPRELSNYQTADSDVFFQGQETRDFKTRISFLVDASGSMGHPNESSKCGASLALSALNVLLQAAKTAIHDGAPAEICVYAFADKCGASIMIDGIDQYTNYDALGTTYQQARRIVGGGTEIVPAINHVAEDLKNYPDAEHIIIVLTDAEFSEADAAELRNRTVTDGKTVFLGVGCEFFHPYERNRSGAVSARESLFGKYNLKTSETAPAVLRKAFLDAIN